MPKLCPACGRPNADRASRCLYCTGAFGADAVVAPALETPCAATPQVSNRHLIILAPQPDADVRQSRVEAFAEAAGVPTPDARLLLQTRRHRLLRKAESAPEAIALSAKLDRARVAHFTLAEGAVEGLPVVPVRSVTFFEDRLDVGVSGETDLRIAYPDLLILVRGEIARERHQERRVAKEHGASQRLTPGLRLHIYAAQASVAPELDPEQFDWSVLGDERSGSTPINFKRLTDEILRRAPQVELDRGFDLEPTVLSRSPTGLAVDALLGEERDREGALYDNEEQFRFYARWRYLVARAEAQSG